jgi:hypothetical protein
VEYIEFWMNFVAENSNKLQQIGFRRGNELSVFTLGANNTCYFIYPWRKVGCFVLSWWYFPNHSTLGYVMELIIKKFSMNKGAMTWFKMFGTTMWNLLIIEPCSWKVLSTIYQYSKQINLIGNFHNFILKIKKKIVEI